VTRFKDFLTLHNLIPAGFLALLAALVLMNLFPKAPLPAGSTLYEKNNYGYQSAMVTQTSNQVLILRQVNAFMKVRLSDPPVDLWAQASLFPGHSPFPAQLFLRTEAGRLEPNVPPFVEKQVTVRLGDPKDQETPRAKREHTSVYVLFSLLLLMTALLALSSQLAKNILVVGIACFLLFYSIYASGLLKTSLESSYAGVVRMLDSIRIGKDAVMRCETQDLLEIARSRFGKNISALLEAKPEADARGYLLRMTPAAGKAWRLIATDGQVRLYFRE